MGLSWDKTPEIYSLGTVFKVVSILALGSLFWLKNMRLITSSGGKLKMLLVIWPVMPKHFTSQPTLNSLHMKNII